MVRPTSRSRRVLRIAGALYLSISTLVMWGMVVAPAAAATRTISLKLSPATIVADEHSKSRVTATVTNAQGGPVTDDRVKVTSSGEQPVSTTTNNHDGTYTATITSTATAGRATIKATDTTPNPDISTTATLIQVAGPAAHVLVRLSTSSILADGVSTSTATATVTDAFNNRVLVAAIGFSSSDAGIRISPVINNSNGTYTSTLTSSNNPGRATIVAAESKTGATGAATLTLATTASTVTLFAVPAAPVTNQLVTLIATVTATGGGPPPSGKVTFKRHGTPIPGCVDQPVVPQVSQRLSQSVCQAAFDAATSPEQLEAIFTSTSPNAGSSTTATVPVGQDRTATSLDVSNPTVTVGSAATFSAQVTATNMGPVMPSGSVDFFDGGQPISTCSGRPVIRTLGSSTATCTVRYNRSGPHSVSARYRGDANFMASASPGSQHVAVHALPPRVLGTISAIMQWTFYYTPTYTRVVALLVKHAAPGATVAVTCRGRGCPFVRRVNNVRRPAPCKPTRTHRCRTPGVVDLRPSFKSKRLMSGARVMVKITRPNWIGKQYVFTMRARRAPLIRITCLAPGGTVPGVGC